jgi:hypothetical protein
MKKLTLLILSCCITFLSVLAQEKTLQEKTDAFMLAHKSDVYDFDKKSDAPMDALQHHPLVNALNDFFAKNGDLFARVRKQRFAQYAPPPAGLENMKWYAQEDNNLDMMSIVFLRSFEPNMPAQMVYNILLPTVAAANYLPAEEVNGWYRKRATSGYVIYTKPLSDSSWQVWSADRTMAVTFVFNTRNGHLAKLAYTMPKDPAYAGIKWTTSMVKPLDEPAAISAEILQTMWDHQPVSTYLHQHADRIKKAREELLKPDITSFTMPATGYKEIINDKGLGQDSLTVSYMYPSNWDVMVQNMAVWGDSAMQMARSNEINRLIGYHRYVRQLDADNWEVYTAHDTDLVYYIWNTRTGKIDKARFWIKE